MSFDDFEFKKTIYLGNKVANKHKFFQEIAKLGFEDAEDYAFLECMKAFFPEAKTLLEGFQAITDLTGMANFLKNTKEITRLALILGITEEVKAYGEP